jgi:hypothetical protein
VIGYVLRGLKRSFIFEIGGDAGCTEGMIADSGLDADVGRAALNHAVGVLLPHRVARKLAGLADGRAEQGSVVIMGDVGGGDIFIEVVFQIMVARDLVLLAAFLVKAHPAASALHKIIPHLHLEHGVDARKAIHHHRDESAITQADH